jgi:hypothetical protein
VLLASPVAAGETQGEAAAVPMQAAADAAERERILGPFLAEHWQLPVPAQGAAPEGWTTGEASLDPDDCRSCHPKQWEEWRSSLHAGAFSPGFAGQLIEGGLAAPAEVRNCQTCHNPLEEQQPFDASGSPSPIYDADLRAKGLVCAGCHVRAHRRLGPPRREGLPPLAGPQPHGGFEERPEWQEARFCAPCHQFFDDAGVAGKPLENTFTEWRESPQAAAGRSCQSCHMPDRAHLWRGIHDPDMVRAAVEVELLPAKSAPEEVRATLVVTNRDVGHAFPSYVTPRVWMEAWQADSDAREIDGTRMKAVIGREVDFSTWQEVFDTRLLPGESATLAYAGPRQPAARLLVARVTVDPDAHYRGVFAGLLPTLSDPEAKRLIGEALRRTETSRFVLAEARLPLAP